MSFKKLQPALLSLAILLLATNFLLGQSLAIDLVQTKVFANNLLNNNQPQPGEVAGVKANPTPAPKGLTAPSLSATAVVAMDLDSNNLLYIKDPNKRVPIASTTKIMTALIGVETYDQSQILTVSDVPGGSSMGLVSGEKISFRSLLYGMLLNSGNDAAFTIAANFPQGGYLGFIKAMNNRAKKMGLVNTHFDNPAGFDSAAHYSSALDLARIAQEADQNPLIARVVSTKDTVVASSDKAVVHNLHNLNQLLGQDGVVGFKTGLTPLAKENLVGLVDKDGHRILTVVLGSDHRFGETKQLIDWVFNNFTWQSPGQ